MCTTGAAGNSPDASLRSAERLGPNQALHLAAPLRAAASEAARKGGDEETQASRAHGSTTAAFAAFLGVLLAGSVAAELTPVQRKERDRVLRWRYELDEGEALRWLNADNQRLNRPPELRLAWIMHGPFSARRGHRRPRAGGAMTDSKMRDQNPFPFRRGRLPPGKSPPAERK